ncbi:D-cysteine desulfhydrase family protein [Acidobacterium sp. S8]|uniref:D-cysteine desulfhydrase family protein n=1 Tax=Acidobacterium sp. S8 TaxID=1641854 RepID=UPI00131E4863|nr:D-cysteine desulfhydrase family protein [Acidobacterium sp. S8]
MNSRNLPLFEQFSRKKLFDSPTPIQRLDRLERELETKVRIYVKRDDLMGLGGGGNKLRKLEFLLGDAISQGADTFITIGGLQSNHARLSAAAAAHTGMSCELVLTQVVPRDDEAYRRNGNVLLDEILGAKIHLLAGTENALDFAADRAKVLKREGRRSYLVGSGGSSPAGCLGYANCAVEILEQQREIEGGFTQIIAPNGSSGTHAGLAAGFASVGINPEKISSYAVLNPGKETQFSTHELAKATLALLAPTKSIDLDAIRVSDDQLGDGYGIPTSAMLEAVRTMARTQGLLLDPVYTGKAFAGVLAAVRSGAYKPGEAILFLMTGGLPGLFAYQPAFEEAS